ncbi:hypothetical protein ACOSQ2_019524 [Xanthoceras sorbifolium]
MNLFDSNMEGVLPKQRRTDIACLRWMLSNFLSRLGCYKRGGLTKPPKKSFTIEIAKAAECPQRFKGTGDCGAYTLRTIEFLLSEQKIIYTDLDIERHRVQMALDVYVNAVEERGDE